MADKAISDLTQALQITGEDLFVLQQGGEAKKLPGSKLVKYAKDAVEEEVQGVKEYADNAKTSADAAAASATKAAGAAQGIDDKVAVADASAKAAASSAAAAAASATSVDEKVQAAQTAATNAAKSETAAKNAQTGAANAQKAAESAQTGAQAAKTAAESAQEAAESAKDAAAESSTAAGQKASQAAQSAEDAASAKSAAETAKTDAQAARDAIVNMIVETVTLETGKLATVSKSLVDNVYKLVFGLPRGDTGAPGPQGAPGNGISGIALKSGTHAPGTSDVYTITLTDGTTFDFEVYNGANGQGAGDMLASVYDPQGKRTDIYKYVDDAIGKIPTPDVSAQIKAHNESTTAHPDIREAVNGKLDKPTNNATATAGQLLTKTADGQEWKDREEDLFVVNMTSSDESSINSVDKTFEEVQAALVAGKTVVARLIFNNLDTGPKELYDFMRAAWIKDQLVAFSLTAIMGRLLAITMNPQETCLLQFSAQPQITAEGILKGDENGISAAIADIDYMAPPTGGTAGQVLTKTTDGQEWKDAPKTTVPATTSILKGDGAGGVVAATPETDYASPETMRKVTLTVAGWSSSTKQQTVAVPGVLADGTKQKVICSPVDESYDSAWNTCYVQCVGHAADSLTFQCDEIPTAAVEVFVSIQPVNFVS